jgi:hypothetical protein
VTCTGLVYTTAAANPDATFSGCTVTSQYNGYTWASNSYIAAPGAATVSPSILAETGEGKSTDVTKLYKNNEDLEVLQVAWTTNGYTFSTSGLTNGGLISGENNCQTGTPDPICSASTNSSLSSSQVYDDINNTTSTVDPPNGLNEYADNDAANETGPSTGGTDAGGVPDATEMRWVGSAGSVIALPNGSDELFLSGAWPGDGDSDAFNQIFYATSTNGEYWTVPTPVLSTDYSFAASVTQDSELANNQDDPLGISAYYSGRAYAPSVVENPDGTLTMVFGADRVPKSIATAGSPVGVNPYLGSSSSSSGAYQPSTNPYYGGNSTGTFSDPALDRNILVVTLNPASAGSIATTTSLTSTLTPTTTVGQSVTYTATVGSSSDGGPATGTVAFTTSAGAISGCGSVPLSELTPDTASCTTTYQGIIDNTVQASYSGDSLFAASANATYPTTTTVSSSDNGSAVTGETVTYSATVADSGPAPTGTVAFSDSAGLISGCNSEALTSSSGQWVAQCAVDYPSALSSPDQVTVTYSGDSSTYSSTSAPLSETVSPAATTLTLSASDSSGGAPVVGEPVTYTAQIGVVTPGAGSPTGTVDFSDTAGALSSCGSVTLSSGTASCTVTYTSALAPPDSVTAAYSGDTNFDGSTSNTVQEPVNQSQTSVALAENTSSIIVGQSATFTAAVTPVSPGAGSPTGTVDFSDSDGQVTACATQSVSNVGGTQEAQCTVVFSAADAAGDTIFASYSGDQNFLGQAAVPTSLTIDRASTTVTVTSSDNGSAVTGETVTYSAVVAIVSPGAATPTGTVSFADTAGVISGCDAQGLSVNGASEYVASCPVTYPAALGTSNPDVLTATYSGDANTTTSSGTFDETVGPASTSVDLGATWSGGSQPVVGEPVTYTATIEVVAPGEGTPTGTVDFSDTTGALSGCGSVTLSSAMASCTVTYTSVLATPDSVTAAYSGDTNFTGSSSNILEGVGQASSVVTLSESTGSIVTGQTVTFTAKVSAAPPGAGSPTGYVDFSDTAEEISGCGTQELANVSGTIEASCTTVFASALATPDSVSAAYSGDGNFTGATSSSQSLSVGQASTSTTVSSSDNGRAVVGEAVTYTATVGVVAPGAGTPTGTVTFTDTAGKISGCNAIPVALSVTCIVTYTAPLASADDVTATYSGDPNFAGSSGLVDESVAKDATTTTLNASPDPAVTGTPTALTATVLVNAPGASTPSGTVTFLQGTTILCSDVAVSEGTSGATASCSVTYSKLPSGSESITASYSGDANETGSASEPLSLTVTEATHLSLSATPSPSHYAEAVTLHAGGLPNAATGSIAFSVGGTELCDVTVARGGATCAVPSALSPGTYSVAAAYSGNATYAPSNASTSFSVVKASTSITLKVSPKKAPFGTAFELVAGNIPAAATGSVTFTVDGASHVVAVSSPTTNFAVPAGLAPGSYPVSAAYSGDTNFTGSNASATFTIVKASAPFSASASPTSAAASQDITLGATGFPAAATGTVAYTSGATALCTATLTSGSSGTVADCTVVSGLAAKSYHVTARYSGSTDYNASSAATSFSVT